MGDTKILEMDVSSFSETTLRKLITSIREKEIKWLIVTIERNWNWILGQWFKKKDNDDASDAATRFLVLLFRLHVDKVLTTFTVDTKKRSKKAKQNNDVSLDSEEIENHDNIGAEINSRIGAGELSLTSNKSNVACL